MEAAPSAPAAAAAEAAPPAAAAEPAPAPAADAPLPPPVAPAPTRESEDRRLSRQIGIARWGGSGLMRVGIPNSGAPGTFKFGVLVGYFTQTGFLCPQCTTRDGGLIDGLPPEIAQDNASRYEGHLLLSATPWSFLEAYLAVHNAATSNDLESPPVLQVLGDTYFGVKAFVPQDMWEVFRLGGAFELGFLNAAGAVGIENVNAAFRAMIGADFSHHKDAKDDFPFAGYMNLNYLVDNSGNLVNAIELARGRGDGTAGGVISRIERFGLGINRVDFFQIGLGVETPFDKVRPFVEWTLDVPVNRQGYACRRDRTYAGDICLVDAGFDIGAAPSRLSLGVRGYPFLDGLGLSMALDLATGGTSRFVEEIVPEMPWQLMFGFSYAVDTRPVVLTQPVPAAAPVASAPPRRVIQGNVLQEGTGAPVSGALVRYQGRPLTGMIAGDDGTFTTVTLEPGTYTFDVEAKGYKPGTCEATVPETTPPPATAGAAPEVVTELRCELAEAARIGNIEGSLVDARSSAPLGNVQVVVTDKLNRSLTITTDAGGAFRFENVPPGQVTLSAKKEGYLPNVLQVTVQEKKDSAVQLGLNRKPPRPTVKANARGLALEQPIHFYPDSTELIPASLAVVQEIAELLRNQPEIANLEIQAHLDVDDLTMTTDQANAVRDQLIALGVSGGRLTAVGLGNTKPAVPNTTEQNRAKNRRVVFIVKK